GLKHISDLHDAYTPLHYVLLFPRGEDGCHPKIPIRTFPHTYTNFLIDINNDKNYDDCEDQQHNSKTKRVTQWNIMLINFK
ncbi:37544_t:CDS:1, partial [Gigaspora margarita]